MSNIILFVSLLLAIWCQIVLAQRTSNGYQYSSPNIAPILDSLQLNPHQSNAIQQHVHQNLRPPPHQQQQQQQLSQQQQQQHQQAQQLLQQLQQQEHLQRNFGNSHNSDNSGLQHRFNHPATNFELPNAPQLHNINYSPGQQQFNPQQAGNVMRFQFDALDGNQGNGIEDGCGPEPIVGQFKPELVDLANGGPLTRMITTCGPNGDCKSIALQSDLNRVLAVLPYQQSNGNNQNRPQLGGPQEYIVQIENQRSAGSFVSAAAPPPPLLVRPRNRRLFEYSEIPQDDLYN